jgi:hypothetical protein
VGVGSSDHVRPTAVNLRVDRERSPVHRQRSFHHGAGLIDEDEILDPYLLEAHPEGVDPKMVSALGVSGRYMASDSFVEPETPEDPERRRQPLLAMTALLLS